MTDYIINESVSKKSTKRYKCPYCNIHGTKDVLLSHIEEDHSELIPQGYTPARVLFNSINHKEKGTCVCGCGRETNWNEDICRYERLTNDPKCKQRYIDMVNSRKTNKYGDWNLAKNPEFQQKMLAGRRISGTYKFKGVPIGYTGSYEKKVLEFLDKVMNFQAKDIMSPGPVIPYVFENEKHFYISDLYIIPYNLIVEIKDGGDNPNNREMTSYRAKQIAKENQIIEDGEFNYVRVTNNQFDQLIAVLAELKLQLVDDSYMKGDKIVRINENMEVINIQNSDKPVLVHYQNNITLEEGLCISKDVLLQDIYTENGNFDNGLEKLKDCSYNLYGSKRDITIPDFLDPTSIYEAFTGHKFYSYSQIGLDDELIHMTDPWKEINESAQNITNYIIGGNDEQIRKLDALDEELRAIKGGNNGIEGFYG